jgi:excisionase family DNA binding protein
MTTRSNESIEASEALRQGSKMTLLTVKEAAAVVGLGRSTVYDLIYAGRIRSVKIGSSRRIRRGDLDDFITDLVEVS